MTAPPPTPFNCNYQDYSQWQGLLQDYATENLAPAKNTCPMAPTKQDFTEKPVAKNYMQCLEQVAF